MAITGLVIWTKYLLWFHLSQTGNRKVTSSFLDFWMILYSSSKKPKKLVLLKPKLEILEQKSSLIHTRTRQFETR